MLKIDQSLKKLRRIYLCCHALGWLDIFRLDDAERGRRFGHVWDYWPDRAEVCHRRALQLREDYYRLIRKAQAHEGIFVLESNPELVELAREQFGPRCVVCRLENDLAQNCRVMGPEFEKGLEEDRRLAIQNRGCDVPDNEFSAWGRSKAWTIDLTEQLNEQGYTFDPATAEFIAFGANWMGCVATFPIHMGRAFGLARPIERRFDWINADWSPMLMNATVVDENLAMPENIRLFILRTANNGPTYGRYVAQYWEGMRGIMDPPHLMEVEFPPESVMECNIFGNPIWQSRALICYPHRYFYGKMTMQVGCGAHTTHYTTVAMADDKLPLEDFRAALLGAKLHVKREPCAE